MEEEEFTVNLETLFEVLRREKSREELQKLPEDFFKRVSEYINEKKKTLEKDSGQEKLTSFSEKENIFTQLNNMKSILRELYNKRERKIIEMALNKSKSDSSIIETECLLKEEKDFFDELVEVFNKYRNNLLINIEVSEEEKKEEEEEKKENKEVKTVRFLHAVPKFLGTDLRVYGPYEEDDIACLPKELADVLISKGRAEEIE